MILSKVMSLDSSIPLYGEGSLLKVFPSHNGYNSYILVRLLNATRSFEQYNPNNMVQHGTPMIHLLHKNVM